MLTQDQIDHFHTFGFLVLRQLLTQDEAARMKREAEQVMGKIPVETSMRKMPTFFFERSRFLTSLLEDDRIYSIGNDLIGPDFLLESTGGCFRFGDTPWHGGRGKHTEVLLCIKIAFYLDPVTKDTGCLRVIPGTQRSHSTDRFEILRPRNDDPAFRPFGLNPTEIPCVPLETQPGDVIAFTEDLLHGSFGGKAGRQQHDINFMANPTTEQQLAHIRTPDFQVPHPAATYLNSDRPRLRRIVSRLVELGCEPSKL